MRTTVLAVLLVALTSASAAEPGGPGEARLLAKALRDLLLTALPEPLYEDARHWDRQREYTEVRWHLRGLRLHRETVKELRNDGKWWKVRVTGNQLAERLQVEVKNLAHPADDRVQFDLRVVVPARLEYQQQNWLNDVRLYSGSVRARADAVVQLRCEAVARVEFAKGSRVPDVVLQFRVLAGEFRLDDVTVEHLPGFGGDAAKLIGEALYESVRAFRPDLEKRLLEKAHQAIAKAGQAKEVRLSLSKWLSRVSPSPN